jgi:hypothetical protein
MEMNAEFKKLSRGFHQNMLRDASSLEDMVAEALLCIEPGDVEGVKSYLDELLSGRYDGNKLQNLWRSSSADVFFNADSDLLKVLKLLRSTIDSHPYLSRRHRD